ncbi:MAG: JmjC domain-containing protein [Acidimicrobiales bacterium]
MDDVLDLTAVDELVSSTARRPEVRMVQDGAVLDPARYCATRRIGGRVLDDVIDPARLADRYSEGATVVLQSLHRTWPAVGRFAAALEAAISHPVQVNAYLTPPGAAGLAPHADEHDVIVVQLHGTKRWTVEGLGELVLQPGDRLYMPTGTCHSAASQSDASLHMTVGILRITYRAVIERILAATPGPLDGPLPLGWAIDGDSSLSGELPGVLDQAAKALSSADVDSIAADERARRRRHSRPHTVGTISSLVRAAAIDADSVVELVPGSDPIIDDIDADGVRLRLTDRTLRLPGVSRESLELLSAGTGPVRVGDLPGIDAESRIVLARRLVGEGMLLLHDGAMPEVPDAALGDPDRSETDR